MHRVIGHALVLTVKPHYSKQDFAVHGLLTAVQSSGDNKTVLSGFFLKPLFDVQITFPTLIF